MFKLFRKRKGQNTAEYAVIFGVVIAAAVGISALIKEGIQDRVVSEIRKIGDEDTVTGNASFDLRSLTNRLQSDRSQDVNVSTGGGVKEAECATIRSTSNESYNASR